MASPFRTFRKNQKLWMAGVTIMAIVAFVFLGNSSQLGRTGGSSPTAVRTKFGNLTQPQVVDLRNKRASIFRLLAGLEANAGGNQQVAAYLQSFRNVLGQDTENDAVYRWVYARTAENMGIVVDDKAVNDLLGLVTAGLPDPQKLITQLLRGDRQEMSQDMFLSVLRDQLLALRLMQLGHQFDEWPGLSASPGERWDYFKRFHQQATIEVAVLSPKSFVKETKEPSSDELKQFFEKYKEFEPLPDSPRPAFRVPRKVNVEYLEADREKFEALITEDEITQEYERDPKKYARDKEDFEKQEAEERAAREKKHEPKPADEPSEKPKAKSTATPAVKPDAKSSASPADSSSGRSTVKPQENKPADSAKPAPSAAKPSGSSSAERQSPFHLVAYAEEKAAAKTSSDNGPTAATAKDTGAAKDSGAMPATVEQKKPADDKKSAVETPSQPKSDKATDAKAVETKTSADEKKPADGAKSPAKTPDTEPSKKDALAAKAALKPIKTAEQRLRDVIRKDLAMMKFYDNIAKAKLALEAYRSEYVSADKEKPTPPDFAALAKQYNMTAGRTGLVTMRELAETDLGKSVQENPTMRAPTRAINDIFSSTALYKVASSSSPYSLGTDYLFWKTDDQAGGVPKWEDKGVEQHVRDVWKLQEARELAVKSADKLKTEASTAANVGKPLKSLIADQKLFEIQTPPKFYWMTASMMGVPAISDVRGLSKVGADFMQKVFELTPGQVAVATNLPKSEIYVVRAVELTPFNVVWEDFTADDTAREYMYVLVATIDNEVGPAWHAKVLKDANFQDFREELKKDADRKPAPAPDVPQGLPTPEEL